MYLILLFALSTILAAAVQIKVNKNQFADDTIPIIWLTISIIALVLSLITLQLCRNDDKSFMVKVQSYRRTIATQRQLSEIERAALTKDILEINATMADRQYWSKSKWIGVYYHNCIDTLKPLE